MYHCTSTFSDHPKLTLLTKKLLRSIRHTALFLLGMPMRRTLQSLWLIDRATSNWNSKRHFINNVQTELPPAVFLLV